jgi:glycerophosphoryl diester phosphodiesterase
VEAKTAVAMRGATDPVAGATRLELPPVIGHRGAAGRAPENTLAGLRRAAALGCRWVEFDVRLTADGELVLLHDERLERTTTGHGKVRMLPLAAIRGCDAGIGFGGEFAGEPVPTLREAITVLGELGLGANIELKADWRLAEATVAATAEIMRHHWPAHLPPPLISSFMPRALAAARKHAPALARGLLLRRAGARWRSRTAVLGCTTVNLDHRTLQPTTVAEIRAAGYEVLAYTVNNPVRALDLFRWGVASVFSDVPDLILAAVGAPSPRLGPAPAPVAAPAAVALS